MSQVLIKPISSADTNIGVSLIKDTAVIYALCPLSFVSMLQSLYSKDQTLIQFSY